MTLVAATRIQQSYAGGSNAGGFIEVGTALDDDTLDELGFEPLDDDALESLQRKGAAIDDDETNSWADVDVPDLVTEADERGLKVEGSGKGGNVIKKDLVAALEADDAKNDG